MDNPYQPPKADLGNEIPKIKSKKGWKIFFWIMALMQLLVMLSRLVYPAEGATAIDYFIDFVISPITILGIFGFAYSQSLIASAFWKVWMVVSLVADAYSIFGAFDTEIVSTSGLEFYLYIGVTLALLVPLMALQYFCLYSYAFKSPEIWGDQADQH